MLMGKAKTKKPRKMGGPLVIMAILFMASGAARVAANLSQEETENSGQQDSVSPTDTCEQPEHIGELLGHIRARQERLLEQDREITDRMAALRIAEAELETIMNAVTAAEQKLQSSLSLASRAMDDDLSSLIAVYESMKPKDAALLFESMPAEFAAGFLAQMRPEIAAEIMAGLRAEQAYGISVVIAGRNAGLDRGSQNE